jgi:hypothetical protein
MVKILLGQRCEWADSLVIIVFGRLLSQFLEGKGQWGKSMGNLKRTSQ